MWVTDTWHEKTHSQSKKRQLFLFHSYIYIYIPKILELLTAQLVGAVSTASLQRSKTYPDNCPGYDTKQSVGEAPVILFTNPSARAGYDTRSIFKRGLTELIFIYCGLFVLILVVFVLFLLSQRFSQISLLAFFRWLTATSDSNAESCNRIPSKYCLP